MSEDPRYEDGYLKPEYWPPTVDEAVDFVMATLDDDEKQQVVANQHRLHFGFGLWIRNQFGLWADNRSLMTSCALAVAIEEGCPPEEIAELEALFEQEPGDARRIDAKRSRGLRAAAPEVHGSDESTGC